MSGHPTPSESLDSGHPGAPKYGQKPKFSGSVPAEDRRYVILTNRGDEYLQRIETGQWDAVKLHFHWTTDRREAQEFTGSELSTVFHKVVAGFSAPKFERVF